MSSGCRLLPCFKGYNMPYAKKYIDRFWGYVHKAGLDDCWEWKMGKSKEGYGFFRTESGTTGSHRFALELSLGRFLVGNECSLHTCDNPPCCNPAHLFVGTNTTNYRDMESKGRRCNRKGSNHHLAKLVEEDVKNIRTFNKMGIGSKRLARIYNVSRRAITNILHGLSWSHV